MLRFSLKLKLLFVVDQFTESPGFDSQENHMLGACLHKNLDQ